MLNQAEARDALLKLIVAGVPRGVWESIPSGAAWAYGEAWTSTRDDPRLASIPRHRRFRAAQDRHFLMEAALGLVAAENGIPFANEVVRVNQWVYGLLRSGSLCLMQKRVRDGREPPPANFRREVAAANRFIRQGNLSILGDVHVKGEQPVCGILIHTTQSQRFLDEGFGKPAFVRLAVPFGDYSGWVATFNMPELIAAYPNQEIQRPAAAPTWKRPDRKVGDQPGEG